MHPRSNDAKQNFEELTSGRQLHELSEHDDTEGLKIIGLRSKLRKRQRFLQAKKILFLILKHICGHIIEVYHDLRFIDYHQ